MKKLIVLLMISIFFGNRFAFAAENQVSSQASQKPTLVTFVYINGSNDLSYENRLKFKEEFTKDVQKMHPLMVEGFEHDELIYKNFLKSGNYKINPTPVIYYWGDRSLNEIKNIDSGLNSAKRYTPRIAQKVRSIFAHCLHDAIWVQKFTNMELVIDDLQKVVKNETDKGNKVVLFGYSAGSFITYQYFLNKFTSIVPNELISNQDNEEIQEIIKNNPVQPTCLDALVEADLVRLHTSGKFYANDDIEVIRKNYPNLDEKTKMACFKKDTVKGVVNFASPLILFYSDVTDASTSINFLSQLMLKNIVENDIFFLTVNYRNDPLGFPNSENLTMKKLQESNSILAKYFKNGNGFVYNKSDLYVPRTFLTAHMAYWKTPKRFVKGVVNAYNEGLNVFYGKTCD
ncbi:hypothetical protein IJE86_00855 [bacterium]|nr:hypothetical protein [bacterium]